MLKLDQLIGYRKGGRLFPPLGEGGSDSQRESGGGVCAPKTLIESVEQKAAADPEGICFHNETAQGWASFTHHQFYQDVLRMAQALRARGISKGDRVAILARPCYEWEVADKAVMFLGGIVVGLDDKSTADDLAFVIRQAEPKAFFIGGEALARLLDPQTLEQSSVVCYFHAPKGSEKGRIFFREELERFDGQGIGRPCAQPDDIAAIIFTSGTTGRPKGIPLRHKQLTSGMPLIRELFLAPLRATKIHRTLAWLPLHNISGRMMGAVNYYLNVEQYFVTDPQTLFDKIKEVHPTFLLVVPRILEKVHQKLQEKLAQQSLSARLLLAVLVLLRKHLPHLGGKALADRLLLRRLREKLWGRELQFLLTGSAPVDPAILKCLDGLGTPTVEVYAMSELGCMLSSNRLGKLRYGSVGKPLDNMTLKLSFDGEIMVKTDTAAQQYWGDRSEACLDRQGWFRTGDLGRMKNGYLYLTGRKRELIKTSTGLRISPAAVALAYADVPGVDQIVVIGNYRKYLSALVSIEETLEGALKAKGLPLEIYLAQEFQAREGRLASSQRVKRWTVLSEPLSIAAGEVTATLKVRRGKVIERYQALIDAMYEQQGEGRGKEMLVLRAKGRKDIHAKYTDHRSHRGRRERTGTVVS